VSFSHGGKDFEILFNRTGAVGGHVLIEEDGETIIDRNLTESVQPQSGLPQ